MVRKVLYPAVFVLMALAVSTAYGDFYFSAVYTYTMEWEGLDGRIYDETGASWVKDGALVQYIVGIDGTPIVDPAEYFGDLDNSNGVIDTPNERAQCTTWLNDGADPADISGGMNQLCYDGVVATWFTGEFETVDGAVFWNYMYDVPPVEPVVQNGMGADPLAFRAWNLTKGDLEIFCTELEVEAWYMTCRQRGSWDPPVGPAIVGMGSLLPGADPIAAGWEFTNSIGTEVYYGWREKNMTDVFLLECIPEPGTMLLIGSSVLLLLLRRKK